MSRVDPATLAIVNDLMKKVGDDVGDVIMRTASLVDAPNMTPIAHHAALKAIMINAMMFDAAARVNPKDSPTQASCALAAYLCLNTILETEHPWHDAIAKVKERWPDAKLPEVEIVDRRKNAA